MRGRERQSETAPLCCVLFISQTHSCTVEQGPGGTGERDKGNGVNACVCLL